MKLNVLVTFGLLILGAGCTNVKETPKGMSYTVVRKGDGMVAKPGQFLVTTIYFKDSKDSVWYDNRKTEFSEPIPVPDTSGIKREEGLAEIFRYLSKGDSVTFRIKAADLYAKTLKQPLPPKIDPKSEFSFSVGVKDVISQDDYMKMRKEMMAKQREKFMKDQAGQLAKDTVSIDSFLRVKNVHALTTASGLRYEIKKKGVGPNVVKGKKITISYAGYLMSGKYFDTNIESVAKTHEIKKPEFKPWTLEAGMAKVIPGFDEAFLLMNRGEKITVYIPSTLGYGPQQVNATIVPNSILIFDIEMLNTDVITPVKK